MGVAASGESKLQHVRVEILLAAGAKMLRVRHVNVNRSLRPRVPQIVEQAPYALVAVGTMATARTGPAFEVPAPRELPGLGKILNTRDPFGSIRSVFPRCSHFFLSRQVTSSRLKKSAIKGGYLRKNPVFMLQSPARGDLPFSCAFDDDCSRRDYSHTYAIYGRPKCCASAFAQT